MLNKHHTFQRRKKKENYSGNLSFK